MKQVSKAIITLVAAVHTSTVFADIVPVRGAKIVRLLSDATNFGYCMAFLDQKGQTDMQSAAGCNVNAVSFNCQAAPEFNMSRQQTSLNWSAAQLAFVTATKVNVDVDTNAVFNGQYCVARRIDNFPS